MSKNRRKNILVIGANGYIGQHIAKVISEKGYTYHLAGRHPFSLAGDKNYTQIDLEVPESFESLLPDYDFIFHFAGLTGTNIGFTEFKKFISSNDLGLLNLLQAVTKKNPNAKIIFPSSRLVYKGQKDQPLKEEDEKEFKTVYAMNKFSCENYLKMYQNYFGIDYTVFRICVPYGNLTNNPMSFGTIGYMISKAQNGENITIFGDGSQKRSLVHVHDLCEVMTQASLETATDNEVFNAGGPDVFSIKEIADHIAKAYNVDVEFVPWPAQHLSIESGDTIFDSSKLNERIQYQYKYNFSSYCQTLS